MSKPRNRMMRVTAAVMAVLALATTAAEAIDLRSWDQKIADPSKRFVVLSAFDNEAVLDKETQLVWERTPSPEARTFPYAIEYCLATNVGGRAGWRLPTAHELKSLLIRAETVLPSGHPFSLPFPPATPKFWSSTKNTVFDGTLRFYVVEVGDSHPFEVKHPTSSYHVWCVRGPAADAASY